MSDETPKVPETTATVIMPPFLHLLAPLTPRGYITRFGGASGVKVTDSPERVRAEVTDGKMALRIDVAKDWKRPAAVPASGRQGEPGSYPNIDRVIPTGHAKFVVRLCPHALRRLTEALEGCCDAKGVMLEFRETDGVPVVFRGTCCPGGEFVALLMPLDSKATAAMEPGDTPHYRLIEDDDDD